MPGKGRGSAGARARRRAALGLGSAFALAASGSAVAQRVAPAQPLTLVVGRADSPSTADRGDGARRGFAGSGLPDGPLRVAWRRSVGTFLEHPPLVLPGGDLIVFSGRGDVTRIGADGSEKRHMTLSVGPLGPGALLADGTIVAMAPTGEALGIGWESETGRVLFRTRVGSGGTFQNVAPFPLDDGGVVVGGGVRAARTARSPGGSGGGANAPAAEASVESKIASLDSAGNVRAEVLVPAAIAWPLIAVQAGVAAIASDGTVFTWALGGADALRVGSFEGTLDGGVAALDPSTLVAVVDGRRVVTLDLQRGETRRLFSAGRGEVVFGPPSALRGTTYVLEATPGGDQIVSIDSKGAVAVFPIVGSPATSFGLDPDAGAGPSLAPIHTATLVDGAGRVAYARPDGWVGIVSKDGTRELGEPLCSRGVPSFGTLPGPPLAGGPPPFARARPSAGFAGLVPTGPGAWVVACEGGTLLEVTQGGGP